MSYVLVVEDEKDSAEVLSTYLRKSGYEVDCRSNGRDALSCILARTPDVVILDLLMPHMDGPSLLEVLRSYRRFQSLPVVVFTGVSEGPLAERARQLKISAMFTKGNATLQEIRRAVEEALRLTPLRHADMKAADARPTV